MNLTNAALGLFTEKLAKLSLATYLSALKIVDHRPKLKTKSMQLLCYGLMFLKTHKKHKKIQAGLLCFRDVKKGLATLCIGGGMGIAMCVER